MSSWRARGRASRGLMHRLMNSVSSVLATFCRPAGRTPCTKRQHTPQQCELRQRVQRHPRCLPVAVPRAGGDSRPAGMRLSPAMPPAAQRLLPVAHSPATPCGRSAQHSCTLRRGTPWWTAPAGTCRSCIGRAWGGRGKVCAGRGLQGSGAPTQGTESFNFLPLQPLRRRWQRRPRLTCRHPRGRRTPPRTAPAP